jgi:hypothetical protein
MEQQQQKPSGELVTMDEAKSRRTLGDRFLNSKGVEGVVIGEGKHGERTVLLARFPCTVAGCSNPHERGSADWHWASKCRVHAAKKGTGTGGTRRREILETDSPAVRAAKEKFNALHYEVIEEGREKKAEEKVLSELAASTAKLEAKAASKSALLVGMPEVTNG